MDQKTNHYTIVAIGDQSRRLSRIPLTSLGIVDLPLGRVHQAGHLINYKVQRRQTKTFSKDGPQATSNLYIKTLTSETRDETIFSEDDTRTISSEVLLPCKECT